MVQLLIMDNTLRIRGARTNNLKNIDLDLPKHKLVVITGLSGSGKSSLAFDTIYAEGQRRYVESLSAYARQFVGLMDKPDVDLIEGLSPAISIDQKTSGHNPRSTVGTVTEIYDYLRLLFARVGHPRSPVSGQRLEKQSVSQIVDSILNYPKQLGTDGVKILILAPVIKNRKGTYEELFTRFFSQGYARVRVDEQVYSLEEEIKLDKFVKHNIEIVIDRLVIENAKIEDKEFIKRLTDSVELAINLGEGEVLVNLVDAKELKTENIKATLRSNGDVFYSEKLVDPATGTSFPEIEPHSFSFNSPFGACPVCNGLGSIKEVDESLVYNPRLTISEGGIYPMARTIENEDSATFKILLQVAQKQKIDLKKPIGQLSEREREVIFYGTGETTYAIDYFDSNGNQKIWNAKYEGVINNLLRRYQETDSEYIRTEVEEYMIEKPCTECKGYRLKKDVLAITIEGFNIVDVGNMSIADSFRWIEWVQNPSGKFETNNTSTLFDIFGLKPETLEEDALSHQEKEIGKQVFKEIATRLNFLNSVGLDYLSLNRTAKTLSGGESQRIRLASQIGTGLTGVMYVLDEPSIGLHQRDNAKLLATLERLRDLGNSVIVVEHDEDTIKKADYIVDIGPGAGEHGGKVIGVGSLEDILKVKDSLTAQYLSGEKIITKENVEKDLKELGLKKSKTDNEGNMIRLYGVTHNNLKNVDLEIPLAKFVAITGVSGSGKSSLVNDVLHNALAKHFYDAKDIPGHYSELRGLEHIDKVINMDQSPIGRTPRSNPATYTGVFNLIRDIFASTKEWQVCEYKDGRLSCNVKGGRCEKCEGAGGIKIKMQFF